MRIIDWSTDMHEAGHDDVFALTDALKRAATAHHAWEAEHGPDEHWEEWYAGHMAAELREQGWHLTRL